MRTKGSASLHNAKPGDVTLILATGSNEITNW
jgi:hypothetical protein